MSDETASLNKIEMYAIRSVSLPNFKAQNDLESPHPLNLKPHITSDGLPYMSDETASLNKIEMHAIRSVSLPNFKTQNDLESEAGGGEISGSVKSDKQHHPDAHIDDGSSDRDQDEGTDASITDSSESSTNDESVSLNEEESEHSQAEGGGTDENMERLVGLFREFLEAASNPGPETSNNKSNPPYTQRNAPARKRLFGLKKGLSPDVGSNNRYVYEQKYPRDEFGKETAANARIWLTYLDEAEAFDRERVEGWKETVDVLLVFAGLFSGVITTFISQASTSLQQDNTQVTASLQFETVQILRAQFSGLPISNVPSSKITPSSPFAPSTNASLVNGLWFTSLAITLSTALFAVLAKQWLYYYVASFSGTPNEKVRARQLRFNGFEQWKVAAIVDLLPILLHLAVGLFLTGIMILLFPLDARIAWTIVVITGITFTLYFVSVILPIRYPECPYTTSLTIYAGILFFVLREILRWASIIFDKSSRAVWGKANVQARHTIQHLIHYTLGVFRRLFMLISKLGGDICRDLGRHLPRIFSRDLGRHLPRIFSGGFPKFTKWREENIKRAVSNATFLDFQAVKWLYTASADRSVHRIIARSVAVHPTLAEHFKEANSALSRTLEVSETNVQDLRYGLCLDLLSRGKYHWHLLHDHVAESELEEGECKTYLRLPMVHFNHDTWAEMNWLPGFLWRYDQIALDHLITGGDSVKLPLAMWCFLLKQISSYQDERMAAHILKPQGSGSNLFHYRFDPTRELVDSAGLVSFGSDELGWWKFEHFFDLFKLGKPDFSSETKSYATRYRLLVTVYRQLTSDEPFITNKEERQKSLENLFDSLYRFSTVPRKPEYHFTFFKEILCVDSFWSESMTDDAREKAAEYLDWVSAKEAALFPYTDYDELSLIYQWCSQDLYEDLSNRTSPIFTVLLLSQNRHHLSTIISNDPKAASNLSTCLRNLGNCYDPSKQGKVIYPLLMDLLKSAKMPLFTHFYNSSVLCRLWELIVRFRQDPKQFFLLVKSKLDRKQLDGLFTAMKDRERLNSTDPTFYFDDDEEREDFDRRLLPSLSVFGQIIGRSEEPSPPSGAMLDNDHDNEERAQVPGPNQRQVFHTVADWTRKAFGYVWSKLLAK